jgi:hypothetical protein
MRYKAYFPIHGVWVTNYLLLVVLLAPGCNKKGGTENAGCVSKYSADILSIINNKCAISNCHNTGSALGDFTTYAGVKARADNGRIRRNVFELKIMPPASAIPLTDFEKEKIKCWLDNGAPQN